MKRIWRLLETHNIKTQGRFFEVVILSYADMYSIDLLLACLTSVAVINSQINCSTYKLFKFR